jgi:hypothetical protein
MMSFRVPRFCGSTELQGDNHLIRAFDPVSHSQLSTLPWQFRLDLWRAGTAA